MSAPAVTVVTVNFNDEAGLERTLASLRRQSERSAEHVVVDGGSSDGSVSLARSNPAFERHLVISEPDKGVYDAMNKGLAQATGELVTFLNAGDLYVHEDVLHLAIEAHRAAGWSWAYGAARVVDGAGKLVRPISNARYHWWRHALGRNDIVHQTVFYEVAALRALGGFDLRFPIAADYHATLRLGRISMPGAWSRVDVAFLEGGISDRRPERALSEMHRARCDIMQWRGAKAGLSRAWFGILVGYIYARRVSKRMVRAVSGGHRLIDWWLHFRRTR